MMSKSFGISKTFLDRELHNFIASNSLTCRIDAVNGIIEMNHVDNKNSHYRTLIKDGDILLNRTQKLARIINAWGDVCCVDILYVTYDQHLWSPTVNEVNRLIYSRTSIIYNLVNTFRSLASKNYAKNIGESLKGLWIRDNSCLWRQWY